MKTTSTDLVAVKRPNKFMAVVLKIGKRNLIIAGTVLLIGVAVLLNWVLFAGAGNTAGFPDYDTPTAGTGTGDSTNTGDSTDATGTYFSATQVNRQRARDEAIEVLQAVVDNPEAAETVKAEAAAGIAAIAEEIQKEANIETLIKSKGFAECVAVLNGDTISIVVRADSLQPAELAQINAIVYEQTGITPAGVTISAK